jgi:hypothetical protein
MLRLRSVALLAAALLCACDDPTEPRPAPDDDRLVVFALLDPDYFNSPVLVQQSQGALADLSGALRTGGVTVAETTVVTPVASNDLLDEQVRCLNRYFPPDVFTSTWTARCVTLQALPQFGTTYEVAISAPGRQTARGTTTVPGDFEIVSHELRHESSGDMHVSATWRRSASVYRYIVTVMATQTGQPVECEFDSDCNERWFHVTEDTSVSTLVPARFFRNADTTVNPRVLAVHAVSREMYGYMMTGVTSNLFPVPPAQNVVGGMGAVGAWVRRAILTKDGLTVQRLRGGLRLTSHRSQPVWYQVEGNDQSASYPFRPASNPCAQLNPGESVLVPQSQIHAFFEFTHNISVRLWTELSVSAIAVRVPVNFY